MTYDPRAHHRRSIRLRGYDYGQPGAYYVTVCAHCRHCLFGEILGGQMRRNEWGDIVHEEWYRTLNIRTGIELDAFVVMPNHIHGIIEIERVTRRVALGGRGIASPLRPTGPARGSIGAIIGQIKSVTSKRINNMSSGDHVPVWQRGFYEHVVRSERDLLRIREYILGNPQTWAMDYQNPANPFRGQDDIEDILDREGGL